VEPAEPQHTSVAGLEACTNCVTVNVVSAISVSDFAVPVSATAVASVCSRRVSVSTDVDDVDDVDGRSGRPIACIFGIGWRSSNTLSCPNAARGARPRHNRSETKALMLNVRSDSCTRKAQCDA
jgi:hypothetical protein